MEGGGSSQRDPSGEELHTLVREGNKVKIEELLKEGKGEHIVDYKLNGLTPLHVAARTGNTEIAEVLMKVGHANIHARSKDGNTPLHLAAQYGHPGVVEKLLQQGAHSDITAEDRRGDTPLHGAAQSGNYKIVKRMLSLAPNRQACILAKNGDLRTPLHYAAGSGNPKVVDLLLDIKEPGLKDGCDAFGTTPFHFAARSGDVKSLEKLAPNDINVASSKGFTALHYAAWNANIDAVKWLMDKGASVQLDKARKCTPLHLAAICNNQNSDKVAEIIVAKAPESWKLDNTDRKLAIGMADECKHGHVVTAILQSLRRLKDSLDGYDILTPKHKPNDATLLHYAAGHGTKEDIEWLMTGIDKGKNMIEIPDASSRTPLHWAAMKGNTSTLKALANAGANLTKVTNRAGAGETPLFLALGEAHMEFAEELLKCDKERSKSPLTTDEWMEGVEKWMMTYYNDKVQKHVQDDLYNGFHHHTKKQSALWLPGGNGGPMYMFQEIPPLYLALHAGRVDIAKFFQRLSSDEDAVNKKGENTWRTALHWAVLLRRRDIVEQLCFKVPEFSERVRVYEEDVYGIAPVQYATELNMQDIEAELLKREAVSNYIAGLYRDRQIYVDSTNAILVGAALIASVTFAGWLQPPLGIEPGSYVDIKKHRGIGVFWVFNSLSFFAAIGTVQAGACGVLPLRHVHIGRAVIYIRRALMVASLLMALSVVCVLGAFGAAGFVVLPPKYEIYMAGTVAFGGLINAGLICWFIQRVFVAPQLLRVRKRHLLGTPTLIRRASPPPDLTPDKEIPRPSVDQQKSSVPVPWVDGIEELYPFYDPPMGK